MDKINSHDNNITTNNYSQETDSLYTQELKPFEVKLDLLKKTKLSKILKRNLMNDQTLLILKVVYKANDDMKFDWEIYKTFKDLKELMISLHLNIHSHEVLFLIRDLPLKIEAFCKLDLKEYNEHWSAILDILNIILTIPRIRDKIFFLEFLEISRHSFECLNEGNKPKEGYILKQTKSRKSNSIVKCICNLICCCKRWQKRWFVLKDDMICYLDNSSSNIGKDVFWFDQELNIIKDYNKTTNSLGLVNRGRSLILKFKDEYDREIWYEILSRKVNNYQSKVKNEYNSFANEKSFCNAKWFVEAESYFADLYDKLMSAKESVYIAGWWISPEVHLKRPNNNENQSSRLMDVLKLKAEEGVEINILVFKEVKLALTVNSNHTKELFSKLHPNVKVTRHPKNNLDLLWSHHEKIVIIDQKIGYVGGVDLCWGRFDTHEHLLHEAANEKGIYHWPGIDYSNCRLKDFENVHLPHFESVDRSKCPRMPWHDIIVYLEGPVISDLCRHFIERWNFARTVGTNFTNNKKYTIISVKTNNSRTNSKNSHHNHHHNLIKSTNLSTETNTTLRTPLIEEEYKEIDDTPDFNPLFKNNNEISDNSFESNKEILSKHNNEVDEVRTRPRRSFNRSDMDFCNKENCDRPRRLTTDANFKRPTKSALGTNKSANPKQSIDRISILDKLKGAFYQFKDKIKTKSSNVKEKIMNRLFKKTFTDMLNDEDLINIRINDKNLESTENRTCQILRSAAEWSVGLDNKVENSILNAYYNLIDNSKHYILIENQFFISKSFTDDENITMSSSNSVVNERIERAYEEKQKFRVFIFIPLLPAFPGEVTDTSTLQIILKYTYKTISRNRGLSLIEKLYQLMQDGYEDYIHFFSLRTHGLVDNIPKTELIYVHSKMMIVDDEITLIGSANINDRSMLGRRDSEIAVMIKDEDKKTSIMDGQYYLASSFAHTLRVRLFKEHLGLNVNSDTEEFPEMLLDPLDDRLFKMMKQLAKANSNFYREIFNCYPDDKFERFSDIESHTSSEEDTESLKQRYFTTKDKIMGNIVDFPLNFLKEENLNRSYFSREILVPIKNFL